MTAPISAAGGEVVFYEAAEEELRLEVRPLRESVWLSQTQMGLLFGRERSVITKHLRNAFREGELDEDSVESHAAHSLYFVIKDHPFSHGDKRIGAPLFLEFLARNGDPAAGAHA